MTTAGSGRPDPTGRVNFGVINEHGNVTGGVQNAPFGRHNTQHVSISQDAGLVAQAREEATKVRAQLQRLLIENNVAATPQDVENTKAALLDLDQVDASLEEPAPDKSRLRYAFDNLWRRCDAITAGITTAGLLQTAVLAVLNA